jgi:transaldolase
MGKDTSTKNPAYSDVLYVEGLVGPDTVNTVTPATFEAFLDHGRVRLTLVEGLDEAEAALRSLDEMGVDFDALAEKLQSDGVGRFIDSFDKLLITLENKRKIILRGQGEFRAWDAATTTSGSIPFIPVSLKRQW